VPQRVDQPDGVARHVENAKRIRVGVVGVVPAGGAAVAALVGGDHVIAGVGEGRHHFAPAVGEFWESVHHQNERPARRLEASFQDVHGQAVHVGDVARANAGGKRAAAVRRKLREIGLHDFGMRARGRHDQQSAESGRRCSG